MRLLIAIFISLMSLTGCEEASSFLNKLLFPDRDHIVILEASTVELSSKTYKFEEDKRPIIRDDGNEICFVIGEGYEHDSYDLDNAREFFKTTGIEGIVYLTEGAAFPLKCPSSSWSLNGRILSDKEISACLLMDCDVENEKGKKIDRVELVVSNPMEVKGVYWIARDAM